MTQMQNKRRLLEMIEFLDARYIEEMFDDLRITEQNTESAVMKRSKINHLRYLIPIAACLILLTAAFPILNYVLPRIGVSIGGRGGNAGAGTSELEAPTQAETQTLETEDEIIVEVFNDDNALSGGNTNT